MDFRIEINIREKLLKVTDDKNRETARFNVICGRNSHRGTKEGEGDQRTPRGLYYVCTINEKSKFTLFFGLSYPNPKDADDALSQNRITEEDYRAIIEANHMKARPPWNTPLGGEVGIHGGGIDRDGTRGCIGMRDEDVLELKKYITLKTPVLIKY